MKIQMILAISKDDVIGNTQTMSGLPWFEPEDIGFFKEKTKGKIVIAGTTTFNQMTPGYVRSTKCMYKLSKKTIEDYGSFSGFIEFIKKENPTYDDTIYIIGGASIYREFCDQVDELIVSHMPYDADKFHAHASVILDFNYMKSFFPLKEKILELESREAKVDENGLKGVIEVIRYYKNESKN